ncbi:uncharacterized protein LOC131651112 [Vicia villosa]|uniref:uncharacterized protein LOC131651112 n=1 Tax=Vicia villosa TaxID=3911 RepID=UPI00273ACB3E|nr:uncharacterized protein LOC131651112 [Vicia villosa]
MTWIVFSSSVSILVNGSPTDEFRTSRGLHQGDPLSPFLFLLAVEGFAGMMKHAVSSGSFKGFKIANDIRFEMLQLAVDTVLIVMDRRIIYASSFLTCQIEKISFIFLGIRIGSNHRSRIYAFFGGKVMGVVMEEKDVLGELGSDFP